MAKATERAGTIEDVGAFLAVLSYDAPTGNFYWNDTCRGRLKGKAGGLNSIGYVRLRYRGVEFLAHRLVWFMHYGPLPEGMQIDHIDGDRANNRLSNLRLATQTQQNMNTRVSRRCRSGLKGAYPMSPRTKGTKPWRSQIKVGNRFLYLGSFDTAQEAHQAYVEAARKHFGEFARY